MSHMLQPSIILLKEGTDTSQGIGQLIGNINACETVASIVKSTLGPCGMDKLVYSGNNVTISNDGATVMRLLDIVHPAAKTLVDIARSQDEEVGDGTTSVVVLASEFLSAAKSLAEEGMHPQIISKGFRRACTLAKEFVRSELAVKVNSEGMTAEERRELLVRCGATSLNSKLIGTHAQFFSAMATDAVLKLEGDMDMDLIGIKKVPGGSLEDTEYVDGVAFEKTFSYAGFEQQPKCFIDPKVLLLNVELELKAEKENAEVKVRNPEDYQSFVDAEWAIIYEKLENIVATGAKVILSRLAIGDLATQYFADREIFCAGRVPGEDLTRVAKATGGSVQTTVSKLTPDVLGTCGKFEENQIGDKRYNLFTGCPSSKTATIILRGGGDQFIDEAERSLHDAIMIIRRTMKADLVVAGGGAVEMELSRYLNNYSRKVAGKLQLAIKGYAKAFETVPRLLCQNAGFDATDILNVLRKKHAQGNKWFGVDLANETVRDNYEAFVWEPAIVKLNSIEAATEAACMILSVDETVINPKSDHKVPGMNGGMGGMGGRPF